MEAEVDEKREKILQEILKKRGFVPSFHKILIEEDIDFYEVYEKLASIVYTNGRRLTKKFKELLFIGILVAMRASREHIKLHIRAALDEGATREDILEVIELAFLPSGVVNLMEGLEAYKEVVIDGQ